MNDKDKARKVVDGEDNNTIQSSSWNSLELGGPSFLVDGSSLVGTSSFHSFSAGPPDFSFLSDHDHEQTRQAIAISSGELRKEEQSFSAGLSDFSFLSAHDHEQTLQTTAISSQLPVIEDSSGELRKEEQSGNEKESSETAALRKEIDRVSGQLRREHLNQRPKRTRSTEIHNMCEKRRRERIREKIKTLQELIPNCDKQDRSSVLDDAIEYLKALKLQEQMLSMARRPMFQAPYMSAAGIPSMQAPHFSPFGPMRPATPGMGMAGFYLPTGLPMMPFSPAYIYPSLSVATAGGLNLNPAKFSTANLQMSYIPPQPFSAAAAATLPSQPICTAINSAPFNYSSNQGESSPQTALRSSTDSPQVTSTSQDQTSEPWTQATSISWL